MKKFILSLTILFTSSIIFAQAFEDKIEYAKKTQPCIVMNYSYPPEAVENAIISRMNKLGYKGKEEKGLFNKDKGFRVYKETYIQDISSSRYDYILKVEKKSRKESDETVLYFLIQKDNENVMSALAAEDMGRAKSFLYNLLPEIEAANLELQILAQEETVTKAEKKFRSLQSNKEDMEKRVKKLQDDIKQNEKDQENQQAEIETQKKLLEELRGKRKN